MCTLSNLEVACFPRIELALCQCNYLQTAQFLQSLCTRIKSSAEN